MTGVTRRRAICTGAAAAGVAAVGGVAFAAKGKPAMTMYRDPMCGCCGKWAELAEKAGYPVTVLPTKQMQKVKALLKVPAGLSSCHTTRVGGYVVEGHVPFAAIDKLLSTKPKGVIGIAVPGMPPGSPGMEAHGGHSGHAPAFKTFAFKADGSESEFRF